MSIQHVAIIMDGNGRWAQKRHRPRFWGHIKGTSVVSEIVEEAVALNLSSLTLYAFSTENWKRPDSEVVVIFKLLKKYLKDERDRILKNKIQFKVIGKRDLINEDINAEIIKLEKESSNHTGLNLNIAINYGGRAEIIDSIKKLNQDDIRNLNEQTFSQKLYNSHIQDIDLVIRTGGDQRISNFLLWEIAYAELFFTPTLWPDFSRSQFQSIISESNNRNRRFGGV
jgi:undecaprenyl diphosphate synthase